MIAPNIFKPRNDWNVIVFQCKKAVTTFELKVREIIMEETGRDPFVTNQFRYAPICQARQIYMTMMVLHTGKTLQNIGSYVNKDHATVLHSIKSIHNMRDTDKKFKELYNRINKRIESIKS